MRAPSHGGLFVWLMIAAAAVTLLLPRSWTGRIRGLFQPIALFQRPAAGLARSVAAPGNGAELSPQQAAELRRTAEELARRVGHQQLRIEELQRQVAQLSAVRAHLGDGAIGIHTAAVVSYDANPRRHTLVIAKGALQGLAVDQWVLAGRAPDELDPQASGRELIEAQWLIGRIVEVLPQTARVQLTSDPAFATRARPARVLEDGAWQPAGEDVYLVGRGAEGLLISEAPRDYYAEGYRIVLAPRSPRLPATLTLGRITASRPVDNAPRHYNLTVEPWGDVRRLSHVYVIAVGAGG